MASPSLTTERLKLRLWRDEDLAPFAALNADPRVMEFFPSVQSEEESRRAIERIREHFEEHGFGLWAVEITASDEFVGFVGLQVPNFEATFTPCVEVGWRLAAHHWGRGIASEAGAEALRFGFDQAALSEIVSFTSTINTRSRSVMERIGMSRDSAADFDHPNVEDGSRLKPHVLYRLGSDAWRASRAHD